MRTLLDTTGQDCKSIDRITLGGVGFNPLQYYLAEHPNIKNIILCVDADQAGDKATEILKTETRIMATMCILHPWYLENTGYYVVGLSVYDVWTPAGMLYTTACDWMAINATCTMTGIFVL